jgi:hypothetical protein
MEEIEERYGDSPGSRLRSLLFVTQRSDKRPCGALAASQGNHQGVRPLEGGIDAWLADNFPFRYRKPRQETRCPLREGIFRSDISLDQLR